MFALLSFTLAVAKPFRLSTAGLVAYLGLFAAVSEVLQLFMPGRVAQLGDIAIDGGGVVCGLVLAGLWGFCCRVKKSR
jgi:VanZ family protein